MRSTKNKKSALHAAGWAAAEKEARAAYQGKLRNDERRAKEDKAKKDRMIAASKSRHMVPMPFDGGRDSTLTGMTMVRMEELGRIVISAKGPRDKMMGVNVPCNSRWNQRKRRSLVGKRYSRYARRMEAQTAALEAEYLDDLANGRDTSWYC